ncbi:MAG: ABC transporter permease, partial [Proteobacteria bacterium]|nr:ABC transporter permease [Pseudomonadota bacterium]
MKKFLVSFLSHLCFWKEFGDEAKYSVKSALPLIIAMFLPVAYPTLISLTYSNQSVVERPIVVLDLDNSAISRDLILSFDAAEGAVVKKQVETIDEGVQEIMSRGADAFVYIPEDFSSNIKHFKQGNMKVYVYATNMMTYASAMTAIQLTVLEKNVQLAVENVANPKGIAGEKAYNVMDPLRHDEHILYAPTLAYASYICPILFVLVFHQMGLLILAFSVGYHRENDEKFRKRRLWYIDYFWRYLYYLGFILLGTVTVYKIIVPIFGWPCNNSGEMMKLMVFMVFCQMPLSIMLA